MPLLSFLRLTVNRWAPQRESSTKGARLEYFFIFLLQGVCTQCSRLLFNLTCQIDANVPAAFISEKCSDVNSDVSPSSLSSQPLHSEPISSVEEKERERERECERERESEWERERTNKNHIQSQNSLVWIKVMAILDPLFCFFQLRLTLGQHLDKEPFQRECGCIGKPCLSSTLGYLYGLIFTA